MRWELKAPKGTLRPLIHRRSSSIGHREWIIEHVNEQELRPLFSLDPIHRRSSGMDHRARVSDPDVHVNVRNWNSINHVHVNVSERSLFIGESTFVWKSSKRNAWVIVSNVNVNDVWWTTCFSWRSLGIGYRARVLDAWFPMIVNESRA